MGLCCLDFGEARCGNRHEARAWGSEGREAGGDFFEEAGAFFGGAEDACCF